MINGRYQLHNKIGQGGMGIVHRATDRLTGEIVALKQVFLPVEQIMFASRPISQTNRELRLALAHEFQVLAGLRHPNIISVLDYGFDENGQPFFTMSYLEGAETIVAAGNGRSVPEKITLLIQTLEALAYLHRRGILHRDLKPDNVLVVGNVVRVLDFGLAAAKEQATESVGSWLYMAPEVLLGQPASEASDLYAVGVLAYQLLAGTHPFNIYAEDTIGEILEGEPDWGKMGVGGELTAVVRTLLAKKPGNRYPTANHAIIAFYQALGQTAPPEDHAIRESYLQAATFVGRKTEMTQFRHALASALAGQGSSWLIGGESGVGKSRLIQEFHTEALIAGFLVLRGHGIADSGGVTYQLWREPLRQLLLATPQLDMTTATILATVVPDVEQLTGQAITPISPLGESAAQTRLFAAITRLFQQQQRPILLLLEDLQWTRESLKVLSYLTRQANQLRLLVYATYRHDERPNLAQQLPDMQIMPLTRFDEENVANLAGAMLGKSGKNPALLHLLNKETEGNAFFLVESVRALAEDVDRLQDFNTENLPETLFPQGVQSLVQRRIAQVKPADQPLLQYAALAGRELDLNLLQPHSDALHRWLLSCTEASVLEVKNGRWQFTHDKIRDGIITSLTSAQLQTIHRRIAETIEQMYPDTPDYAATLIYHWHIAQEPTKERTYAALAGQFALEQYAYEEAQRHLKRALMLTAADQLEQQFQLYLLHERACAILGENEQRLADLEQLAHIAHQLGNTEQQIEIELRHIAYDFDVGHYDTTLQTIPATIDKARQVAHNDFVAEGYHLWGISLIWNGQPSEAMAYLQRSLAHFQAVQNKVKEADILHHAGNVAFYLKQYSESYDYFNRSLTISQMLQNLPLMARTMPNRAAVLLYVGLYEEAMTAYEAALKLGQELGYGLTTAVALNNIGIINLHLNQLTAAQTYFERSLQYSRAIQMQHYQATTLHNLGRVAIQQGNLAAARTFFQQAYAIRDKLKLGQLAIEDRIQLAQIDWREGAINLEQVSGIFQYLDENPALLGTEYPFHAHLICIRLAEALDSPRRTPLLHSAYTQLIACTEHITDERWRDSFLSHIPEHRALVQLYNNMEQGNESGA